MVGTALKIKHPGGGTNSLHFLIYPLSILIISAVQLS